MRTREINKNNSHVFGIIACIGLFFSCILIIRAYNDSKTYDAIASNSLVGIKGTIGKEIIKTKNTMEANVAIQAQEYKKALQLISGESTEDYYNRGTIQTLLAYQNALGSSISGLENAQIFIAQAQQSFDIAKKLTNAKVITNAIINNQKSTDSLSTVIDIKTCYGIGQNIIIAMNGITDTIQQLKKTLDQEEIDINKRKSSLDTVCYEKLRNIVDTSKEQVRLLQLQMQKNTSKYIADFSKKIEDPITCINTPYENILPSMIKGEAGLQGYRQQHTATIEALRSNTTQSIKDLCEQSKNDAQINQEIQDSVQELLQKLEDNKIENQEKKKSTNQVQYKDFFDENQKKALQEIQHTNEGWINTMLDIRGKGNYTPERYINDMFNQFYGNSGDFIDLHK